MSIHPKQFSPTKLELKQLKLGKLNSPLANLLLTGISHCCRWTGEDKTLLNDQSYTVSVFWDNSPKIDFRIFY